MTTPAVTPVITPPVSTTKEINVGSLSISVPVSAISSIYDELKTIVGSGTVNIANISELLIQIMQLAEGYSDLSGDQKKALVLDALDHLIDDQIKNTEEAQILKKIVQYALPSVVDIFIGISNGDIKVDAEKCWSKFISLCKK